MLQWIWLLQLFVLSFWDLLWSGFLNDIYIVISFIKIYFVMAPLNRFLKGKPQDTN